MDEKLNTLECGIRKEAKARLELATRRQFIYAVEAIEREFPGIYVHYQVIVMDPSELAPSSSDILPVITVRAADIVGDAAIKQAVDRLSGPLLARAGWDDTLNGKT